MKKGSQTRRTDTKSPKAKDHQPDKLVVKDGLLGLIARIITESIRHPLKRTIITYTKRAV